METSGFFTAKLVNGEYDRKYIAEEFAKYFARFIGNGVFMNKASNALMVEAIPDEGMKIGINIGDSFNNGYWYSNSDILKKSIAPADGVLKRIDLVVVRYSNEGRDTKIQIIKGTPSNNPAEPAFLRNVDYFDLVLARISIPAGATKILSSYITDLRLDKHYCGSVGALVEQIDTTSYGAQLNNFIKDYLVTANKKLDTFQDSLNALQEAYKKVTEDYEKNAESEFNAWFNDIKGKLQKDPAKQLQDQIDLLRGSAVITVPASNWTANGSIFKNKINVTGIRQDDVPIYSLVPIGDSFTNEELEAFYDIDDLFSYNGYVELVAKTKPDIDLKVVIKIS